MSIGSWLGISGNNDQTPDSAQAPVGGAPDAAPPFQNQNNMKMLLAKALMNSQPGQPANSFAGGLAQGMNPLIQQMMMQKLYGGQTTTPGLVQSTVAPSVPLAGQGQ